MWKRVIFAFYFECLVRKSCSGKVIARFSSFLWRWKIFSLYGVKKFPIQLTAKLASFATGLATDCRSNFLQFFNLPTCKSASINIDFRVPIIVKIDSKSNGTWKVFLVFISAFPTRSQTARRIFDIADTDGGNRLETRLRRMSTCSLFPSPWCCKIYVERNVACWKSFDAKSFPFSVYTITIGFAWLAFVATKIEV